MMLREEMARALCAKDGGLRSCEGDSRCIDGDMCPYPALADAALVAIEAAGNRIVPTDQLADIYKRFRRLIHIGQAEVDEWLKMPPGEAAIRHAVFAEADFGALYAGQWLPRDVYEAARKEAQAALAARPRDVAPRIRKKIMDKARCSTTVEILIAKLEAAPGGSRELDELIAKAVGTLPLEAKFWCFNPEDGNAEYNWDQTDPDDPRPYLAGGEGIAYTTSIDAALTLVPEGWSTMLDINPGEACCTVHDNSGYVSEPAATTKTPALALCIAALRARQTISQTVLGTPSDTSNTESSNTNTTVASPDPETGR